MWEQFGETWEDALEKILLFKGKTEEKVERGIALLEEMRTRGGGEEKWINKCWDLHIRVGPPTTSRVTPGGVTRITPGNSG